MDMTRIIDLPEKLLLLILDCACERGYSDSAFSSVNRSLSERLLTSHEEFRSQEELILISHEKWVSDEERAKLLGMIDNQYHQLSLIYDLWNDNTVIDAVLVLYKVKGLH